jgi:hypothetical protein
MLHLYVAFIDGTTFDGEYPNHELDTIEAMIAGTPRDLLCCVEIEDNKETIIYSYKRKTTYVY